MNKPSLPPDNEPSHPVPFERRVAILSAFIAAVCIFVIGLSMYPRRVAFDGSAFWGLVILASLAALPAFLLGRSVGHFLSSIAKAQNAVALLHQQLAILEKAFYENAGVPLTQAEAEARLIAMARDEDVIKRQKALKYCESRSRLSTAWQHWVIHDRYLGAAVGALIGFVPLFGDPDFSREIANFLGWGDGWGAAAWQRLFLVVGVAALVGALLHQLVRWTLRGRPGHASGQGIAAKPPGIDKKTS